METQKETQKRNIKICGSGEKFDLNSAIELGTNWDNNTTRWSVLLKTAGGKYIEARKSRWQGEINRYLLLNLQEAITLSIKLGIPSEEFEKEFGKEITEKDLI